MLRVLAATVLVLAVCSGGALRWIARGRSSLWNSDEGISYLMSSCSGRRYGELTGEKSALLAKWVPAQEWQGLIGDGSRVCLATVSRDLAAHDIHPPLYFWLLNVWTAAFGRAIAAGMALSVVLWMLTALALYSYATRFLGSRLEAVAVTLIASASSMMAQATLEFRPYVLLCLVTLLYAHALERCCIRHRPPGRRDYAYLAAAAMAGALTHHLFWFVIAASAVYAAIRVLPIDPRRLPSGIFSVVVGAAAAAALFPLISQVAAGVDSRPHEPRGFDAAVQVGSMISAFVFKPWRDSWALAAGLAAVCAALVLRWRVAVRRVGRARATRGVQVLLLMVLIAAALTWQYGAGFSPPHAGAPKYFASVWAFAAFLPVFAARVFGRYRMVALAGICALYAVAGWRGTRFKNLMLEAPSIHGKRVVVDSVSRLHLPRLLARIDPKSMLLVAPQAVLLAEPSWIEPGEPLLYVGCAATSGTSRKRRTIVALLSDSYRRGRVTKWGKCWKSYEFKRKK
jgi:hypothetical protein